LLSQEWASVFLDGLKSETRNNMSGAGDASGVVAFLSSWTAHIRRHRAVKHPFLERYAKGGIDGSKDAVVYLEFYAFIRFLPFYMAGLAFRAKSERTLAAVARILIEETGISLTDPRMSTMPHLDLYRTFLATIGVSESEAESYSPSRSAAFLDTEVSRLYTECPTDVALGAMFAIETMSHPMIASLSDGLRRRGYSGHELKYFEEHLRLEEDHASGVRLASEPSIDVSIESRQQFDRGVREILEALAKFWDGVSELCARKS
jgi:pyrroloquinoline quinone (PQQ) biosynthesis protein C